MVCIPIYAERNAGESLTPAPILRKLPNWQLFFGLPVAAAEACRCLFGLGGTYLRSRAIENPVKLLFIKVDFNCAARIDSARLFESAAWTPLSTRLTDLDLFDGIDCHLQCVSDVVCL